MTGSVMLHLVAILYEQGYLWSILWLVAKMVGWWGAPYVLRTAVSLFMPVPNPDQALYIARCAAAVIKLADDLSNYPSSCGSS